jgi:hypothetical protein
VSELKAGDKVWVLCEVAMVYNHESLYVDIRHDDAVFEAKASDCRPVEPKSVEQDLPKFNPGDCIRVASPSHEWDRKIGEILCFDTQGDGFTSYMVKLHDLDYAVPIPSHLMKLNNPRPTKEPTQGQKIAERTMKAIWAANDWGSKTPVVKESLTTEPNSPRILDSSSEPLAPSPCMDGVDVDQFIEGVTEARGRTSDPINPSHYKHLPAEAIDIIEAAIAKAPSNQYAFLQGQVIKYLLRCWSKKGIEDLRKAKWYLDRLVNGFDDLLAEASGANDRQKEAGE